MEFINKRSILKKWLDLHVTPNGVFSTVVEHNFFGRLGTCRKVMGEGGGESEGTRNTHGSMAKTIFRSRPSKAAHQKCPLFQILHRKDKGIKVPGNQPPFKWSCMTWES